MSTQKYYVKILIIQNNRPPGAQLPSILYNRECFLMKFHKYIAYKTHTHKLSINCMFSFIKKAKENAINMEVQLKVLLNVFLGL